MEPRIVVTLDIGGSGVKASAYDVARSLSLARVTAQYRSEPDLEAGSFRPDSWWSSALESCRDLVDLVGAQARDYLGITISAIRIPFVLLDRDHEVVLPSLLNRDRRADAHARTLARLIGERSLYETTGHWAAPEFGLAKVLWIRETYPEAWESVATILQLHDWFIYKLSGLIASEPSSAAMSQMMNIQAGGWAADLLAAVNVPGSLLPPMRPAGEIAGPLLPWVAAETGMPAGLPVHMGGGDTHMSAIAAGALTEGYPVIVAGTTGPAQLVVRRGDARDELGGYYPLVVSEQPLTGNLIVESNAGPTGEVVDRLSDVLEMTGGNLRKALASRGFEISEAGAQAAEPLVFAGNPFFGPEGWEVWPRPLVAGLRPGDTGASVREAALRGTCLAFAAIVDQLLDAADADPESIVATGGMSASPAWNAMLAGAVGRPVRVRPPDRLAGLAGAALVAGPQTLAALDEMEVTVYTPDQQVDSVDRYAELFRVAQRRVAGGSGASAH